MKANKKLIGLALAGAMLFGTSIPAFAASASDVTTALQNAGVSSSYISQAQSYLSSHTVDSSKLDDMVAQINNVAPELKAVNGDISKLTDAQKTEVKAAAQAAAADAGLQLAVSKDSSGNAVATLTDAKGATVFTTASKSTLPVTGTNYAAFAALGLVVLLTGTGAAVVYIKRS